MNKPRSKAPQGLTNYEERFRSYFDLPLIGIAITSPDKGWIEVNDRLCQIFGYSREELTHMTWVEITHPDDVEMDVDQFNQVLAGKTEGYSLDKRFVRKDGEIIFASISVRCVRFANGKADYFVALVQDITERKMMEIELAEHREHLEQQVAIRTKELGISERKFKSYFDLSLCGFAVFDSEGRWIEVNDKMCDILGYPREELLNFVWADFTHPDDIGACLTAIEKMKNKKGDRFKLEKRYIKKNGEVTHVEVSLGCFRNTEAIPECYVALIQDINERKRNEAEKEKLNKDLENRIKERTQELENKNIALNEILGQIEIEKNQFKKTVSNKVNKLLIPLLKTLGQKATGIEGKYLGLLEKNLNEITSGLGIPLSKQHLALSSRELEVCNMINGGLRTKDIASFLNLSIKTIDTHRHNIRKKLGIRKKGTNLTTYLKRFN